MTSSAFLLLSLLGVLATARAEEAVERLEEIDVDASATVDVSRPTDPSVVSRKKVQQFQYTDVGRALRNTPGVYVREEDGQGLRPNIGLRGTNPDRSKKVVIMEDGVLIGPAPYSAPAAYYTPFMNETESLEVYRGFTAVTYGPNSVGGAVNYVTPALAEQLQAKLSVQRGSFATNQFKAIGGGRIHGDAGAQIQASWLQSDGFKMLDGGGDTGFQHRGVNLLLESPLSTGERANRLRARLGWSDEDSDETYLGLTLRDFYQNSRRRYAASALDEMRWKHQKIQLEHEMQTSETGLLRTTAYNHAFHRAWYRMDRFRGNSGPLYFREVLRDPTGTYAPYYDVVSGRADSSTIGAAGELIVANNDRDFVSRGIQTKYFDSFRYGAVAHEFELGARLHYDRIRRLHGADAYEMLNGRPVRTATSRVIDANNEDSANARTLTLLNNFSLGPVVLTGVARYENVAFKATNFASGAVNKRHDDVLVPGGGLLVHLNNVISLRGSINGATTLAGLEASGSAKREESTNYEVGVKYNNPAWQQALDVTVFRNAYENITGTCTGSTGCSSNQLDLQFSGGKARIQGVEAALAQGLSAGKVRFPLQLTVTLLSATFRNSFLSDNAEWGQAVGGARALVRSGDPLPYVPRLQYALNAGMEYKRFRQEFSVVFQDRMVDQSAASGREEIPAYGIVDWSANFGFLPKANLFAKVDNLLGRNYLVSLRPFGARPGKPRAFTLGLSYEI